MAFCGINCSVCPAYLATQENDTEKLAEVAENWSSEELELGAEDVVCDGCKSERIMSWANNCTTRVCGLEKGVENCAQCGEYLCEKLEKHWENLGEGTKEACKATLDELAATYRG